MQGCGEQLGGVYGGAVEDQVSAFIAGRALLGDVGLAGHHVVAQLLPVHLPNGALGLERVVTAQ